MFQSKVAMVVDDADDLRHLASSIVRSFGYRVIEASGGNPAFQMLLFNSVDILVTDLDMGNGSGYDLVRKVHALRPDLPVLVISSSCPQSLDSGTRSRVTFIAKGDGFAENLARAVITTDHVDL